VLISVKFRSLSQITSNLSKIEKNKKKMRQAFDEKYHRIKKLSEKYDKLEKELGVNKKTEKKNKS
jgi:prefoldin subunit 5